MPVTGATIRTALATVGAVGKQIRSFDELAAGADDALRQAPSGLTAAGAASFLADKAQESAYLRTTTEYGSGHRYAPYIGRTFQQLTWRENYAAFGAWCAARNLVSDPNVFVKNPTSLSDYRWAWLGGVFYFQTHNLWRYANAGNHYAVSQGVNRGVGAIGSNKAPLHWKERNAMYQAFLRAGDALLPSGATPASSAPAAVTAPPCPPPDGDVMRYVKTPEPAPGTPKNQWPTERVILAFRPDSGVVKVDHGGRGGWIHLGRWWVRRRDWNANQPFHDPQDHPGIREKEPGVERFVGYGWETAGPTGADMIEIVLSAPDGAIVQYWRTK